MGKILKIALGILTVIILVGLGAFWYFSSTVDDKVENFLKNDFPENLNLTYDEMVFDKWSGTLKLTNPKFVNTKANSGNINSIIELDSFIVEDFGYLKYLRNGTVDISNVKLYRPKLVYYHKKPEDSIRRKYSKLEQLQKVVNIGKIMIDNGSFEVKDAATDSLLMSSSKVNATVSDLNLNPETVKIKIPFHYSAYDLNFENFFYGVSEFDNIHVKNIHISEAKTTLDSLTLKTKYSRETYSKILKNERDHFNLSIGQIDFDKLHFGYERDTMFVFKSPSLKIKSPNLNIYRDKQVADDKTIKRLYSQMLRELNFELSLDKTEITDGIIEYSEKINSGVVVDAVKYSELHAVINRLGNTYKEPVDIDINAKFMQDTPIEVKWDFDVHNKDDDFEFKANIGKLYAAKMNAFSEPTMNVRLEGALHKTYFSVYGDKTDSQVNLKINYDDFRVVLMQKKERKENKVLSAIANLFVKKDSDKEPGNFLDGSDSVVRDRTKSIFNFLWLNTSAGLKNAMTGKGKKK